MTMVALLLQTNDPVLKDVRMRRALALALDTPEIARTVTEGPLGRQQLGRAFVQPLLQHACRPAASSAT
jgi:ABC-type oligopeptide transport system substrate-binding subunit